MLKLNDSISFSRNDKGSVERDDATTAGMHATDYQDSSDIRSDFDATTQTMAVPSHQIENAEAMSKVHDDISLVGHSAVRTLVNSDADNEVGREHVLPGNRKNNTEMEMEIKREVSLETAPALVEP